MEQQRVVIVFGSMNMDLSIACERVPEAGETLAGSDFFTAAGGKGANQAVAAARAGARTIMIAAVGRDAFGNELVAGLEAAGVDCTRVRRLEETATGTAVILRSGGDNRIVLSPAANVVRSADDVVCAIDELVASGAAPVGSILITQGECSLEATAAAIVAAHRHGLYTIFNPAPACTLPPAAWREVDLVCLNETECAAITGINPADDASQLRALRELGRLTGGEAVITLGGAGSVASLDEGPTRITAQRCEAVDTTAAGDTFIGVMAAMRAQGFSLAEALVRATVASAVAVTRPGAQPSIPTSNEVQAWIMAQPDDGAGSGFPQVMPMGRRAGGDAA